MSNKQFISNLNATYADVRKLDVKKINLKGKDILEYIEESTPTITHSQDIRETIYENDLWGQWVETKSDGTIIIHDDWVTNPNGSNNEAWNTSITKVEDNMAYTSSGFYANIQTEKIKDGSYMFEDCVNLTIFDSDLSSLTYAESMFDYCTTLTTFTSDLSSLTDAPWMFYWCENLTIFDTDLNSLSNSNGMFSTCENLKSFTSDLSSLTYGESMFAGCYNLINFNCGDLSSLTNGESMFDECTNLTSFNVDLPSLTTGSYMFEECTNLITVTTDLPNLTDGGSMFKDCTNLTTFTSDLSSLTNGQYMFTKTKLTPQSVMYIADSIKDITTEKQLYINGTIPYVTLSNGVYSAPRGFMSNGSYVYTYNNPQLYTTIIPASEVGELTLGINVANNADTIQQQLEDFAKEAYFDSWADLKQEFIDKGWTVAFQYGGTDSSITLSEDEQFRGVPVYARLVEVSDEDKDMAEYCSEDGTKFYNIDWGHDVTDYDSYQYFGSLLEACGYFGIIPKKYLENS